MNFNTFWGFQSEEYLWGYENFADNFLGSS